MPLRLSRRIAAAAAMPLAIAGLVALGATSPAAAAGACTAGVTTTPHVKHTAKPRVEVGRVAVKHTQRTFTATRSLSAAYWTSVSVTATQTICSGDTTDTPLTYSTSVAGASPAPASAKVRAKGHTKAQAKRAVAKKLKKAKKSLAARASSAAAKRSAVNTASAQARRRVTGVSHVAYLTVSDTSLTMSLTAPLGTPALSHDAAGEPTLTVPPGYAGNQDFPPQSYPCLTKASTWPSTYVFDGGLKIEDYPAPGTGYVTFDDLSALQTSLGPIGHFSISANALAPEGLALDQTNLWDYEWDGNVGQPPTAVGVMGFNDDDSVTTSNDPFLCFATSSQTDSDLPGGTVTLHGARVGSGWMFSADGTVATMASPVKLVVG